MEIIQVSIVILLVFAMFFMLLWSTFIEPIFYSPYLYRKYVVSKYKELDYHDLLTCSAEISEKIKKIPVINLHKEELENAEDTLGFEVEPIEFNQTVIESELTHIKYSLLKDEIKSFSHQNQLPLRMVYRAKNNGVDEIEMIKGIFQAKYPSVNIFDLDELVSLQFIKQLLTKNIVLLGVCGYTHDSKGTFQMLLLPYEKKIDRSYQKSYEPIPTDFVECV